MPPCSSCRRTRGAESEAVTPWPSHALSDEMRRVAHPDRKFSEALTAGPALVQRPELLSFAGGSPGVALEQQLAEKVHAYTGACSSMPVLRATHNHAMLVLALHRTARVGDHDPRRHNLGLNSRFVRAFGKGSKERIAPFGYTTTTALHRYLLHFGPHPALRLYDYAFLGRDGCPLAKGFPRAVTGASPRLSPDKC